jgi:16S rRNA (cytosine967-C5)-methyltransferase
MAKISIARSAAHAMLLAIQAGIGHSDDLLRNEPLMLRMSDADRRLTTTLVLGVLRWQIHLDQEIRRFLAKPNTKFDPAVLIALRLGAYQLLHLDRIPPHAAIDESVELVKHSRFKSAAGLVNAVLRKMAAQQQSREREPAFTPGHAPARTFEEDLRGHDFGRATHPGKGLEAFAPEVSFSPAIAAHPAWMVERWTKFFGNDITAALCLHDQHPPHSSIRLASPFVQDELAAAGITVSPGHLLTTARRVEAGDVIGTTAFRDGRVRLQDEGSQLVAELAATLFRESPKLLDCCAAPGGKTLILAERNPSAHITACESSPPRLKQLSERLGVLTQSIECRLADAASLNFDSEFDLALADVPCSGTGTLSRNPEIRHRLNPADLPRQAQRQRAILASALRSVRPRGRVVYSTCSLEPEENEEVIQSVLAKMENAHIVPLGSTIETLCQRGILVDGIADNLRSTLSPEGFLRLIPGAFGTDGFFIAMVEKSPPHRE